MQASGWKLSALGDVCIEKGLQTGPFGSQLHASDYVDSGVPIVMPKDIRGGKISDASIAMVSKEKARSVSKHKLQVGDLIFSRRGDLSKLALVTSENDGWLCGTGCMRARLTQSVKAEFIYCQVITSHSIRWLELNAVGQTMPNLNTEILSQLPIRIAPIEEQREIATILSTWDRAIELTEKLIAAKQKRKQALMQQLLTGKVRLRKFQKSNEKWNWLPLGELASEVQRMVDWDDETLYKLSSIRRHSKGMFFRDALYGRQIKVKKLFTIESGDFLISNIQAAYGAMGLVTPEYDGSYVSDQYTVLVSKNPEAFDIRFLGYLSETAWYRHEILRACNGFFAERLRLLFSATELLKRKIFVAPTVEEQTAVVEILQTADNEIELLQAKCKKLQEQKKGLMQQLLTGKTRVKVAESVA